MKTEYPEFNDKEVIVVSRARTEPVYVNGCDYNIGISVSRTKGGTDYTFCLWHPMLKKHCEVSKSQYRKLFHLIVKRIQKGEIRTIEIRTFLAKFTKNRIPQTSADSCPFNQ